MNEVGGALAALEERLPGVAYPNSGEVWHADAREWSGAASTIAAKAGAWVDGGARLVGGCCRVGPDQIAEIARTIGSPAA